MMSPETVANRVFDGYISKKRDLIFTFRGKTSSFNKETALLGHKDYLAYKEILNERESVT